MIKKVKNTALWTYFITDLNKEENVGKFKKQIKKKRQYMLNEKDIIIHLTAG